MSRESPLPGPPILPADIVRARVLRHLEESPGPIHPTHLVERLGLPRRVVAAALGQLVKSGGARPHRGRQGPCYSAASRPTNAQLRALAARTPLTPDCVHELEEA